MPRRYAATVALLALLMGLVLATVTAAPANAGQRPCWERVIDDWLDDGTINAAYPIRCYQQALKNMNEDLRDYSGAGDAIDAALQAALRGGSPTGGAPSGATGESGTTGDSGTTGSSDPNRRPTIAAPTRSPYQVALGHLGTTSSDSLPIPLLVLAGFGALLLVSAGGLAAHKRLVARKPPVG